MFENRALRRIFGPKRDDVTGEWRKLHNDLYSSPNTVRVIKSRRMRWAEHVASKGREEVYTWFWWGNLRERDHLDGPGVDGRIILRWIFAAAPVCSMTHFCRMSLPKVCKISASHSGVGGDLTLPVNDALLSKENRSSWPASPLKIKAVRYKQQRTCSTVRTHDYQIREGTQYYTELREYT